MQLVALIAKVISTVTVLVIRILLTRPLQICTALTGFSRLYYACVCVEGGRSEKEGGLCS